MSRRSIGKFSINFGMISVPTLLYTATSPQDVSFHQITPAGNRTKQLLLDSVTGEKVDFSTLRKGYEYVKDFSVILEPDQIAALNPQKDKIIKVSEFVNLSEIDPLQFDKSYFLAPDKGGERAFALLLAALKKTKKAAMATFVLRQKEQAVVIRARGNSLLCSTLFYADEIVAADEIPNSTVEAVSKDELAVAIDLVGHYSAAFDITKYRDTFRDNVLTLIEKEYAIQSKPAKGTKAAKPKVVPTDLMATLRASVEQAKARKAS